MPRPCHCQQPFLLTLFIAIAFLSKGYAEEPSLTVSEDTKSRIAWTTSKFQGTPEPPPPYREELAFPKLKFQRPTTVTGAPNSDRLFVMQVNGEMFSFPNDPNCETADSFGNLREHVDKISQVFGMTFHPKYPEIPYVYLCYVVQGNKPDGSTLSRFRVNIADGNGDDVPTIDFESELVLFRWLGGGHNGCCLKFGPDGYLYISTGDGAGPNPPDIHRVGQDLTNLLSAVLRIDVDRQGTDSQGTELNYAIPADNPFVDLPDARPEIWAYGFRNPWKMSFDRKTGDLWVGDVGWDTWELIYRVTRGGNYGWSITEGSQPIHPTEKRGPTPILPPITQHNHFEAKSITGGFVYHGDRLPELKGAYVYGDYETGKIWALRTDGATVTSREEIAQTSIKLIAWVETNQNELLLVDYARDGQIFRLIPNDADDSSASFPQKLSETGLFESVAEHTPAAGVVEYEINVPKWSDGLVSLRFVGVPGDKRIGIGDDRFSLPQGTVIVKTLSCLEEGKAPRRVETQVLHRYGQFWLPYSYVWNEEQTDAHLAEMNGTELQLATFDESLALAGKPQLEKWRIASRTECSICHNRAAGGALAMTLAQLNVGDQLMHWHDLGLLNKAATDAQLEVKLSSPMAMSDDDETDDETDGTQQRALTYLHANCTHCHRPEGSGAAAIRLGRNVKLKDTGLIDAQPTQGTFGLPEAKIVSSGDPYRSTLFYRMAKVGSGRMPHLGSAIPDEAGVRLIHDWICSLDENLAEKGTDEATDVVAKESDDFESPQLAVQSAWRFRAMKADGRKAMLTRAASHSAGFVHDLFDAFLPESQRSNRLGANFDFRVVLQRQGNEEQGRQLFWHHEGLRCGTCHRVLAAGGEIGPDLSNIGQQPANDLLTSLAKPSAKIDEKFRAYSVTTSKGTTFSGLRLSQENDSQVYRTADNRLVKVTKDEIDEVTPLTVSLMPEQLLRDLTPQQAADLLAYLGSLKLEQREELRGSQ